MSDKDPDISSMADRAVEATLREMEEQRRKGKKPGKRAKKDAARAARTGGWGDDAAWTRWLRLFEARQGVEPENSAEQMRLGLE